MVNSAWFFSTLSQATAAIVGLLVSARLIQYQLERQRRERRTEDLREETKEFEEKFGDVISPMAGAFFENADLLIESTPSLYEIHTLPSDELNLEIAMESSKPVVTLYWAHMVRVNHVLMEDIHPSPDPERHYLLSEDGFGTLRDSIKWLKTNMDQRSAFIEYLYTDLGMEADSPYTANVLDVDMPRESLHEWLQRHYDWNPPSGKNLQSYQYVIGELHRDFQRLDSLRQNTIITFESGIGVFLKKASALVIVGVILPLTAITSDVPEFLSWLVIDGAILFMYEMVLLIGTVFFTVVLLDDLRQEFENKSLLNNLRESMSEYQN
jgi:hypothetical protein